MKKLILLPLLTLIAVCAIGQQPAPSGLWTSFTSDFITSTANQNAGSDGSQAKPWIISSPEELAHLANLLTTWPFILKGDYFKLSDIITEIDLGAHYWVPMGVEAPTFEAHFDGNNKPIKNLMIDARNSIGLNKDLGLFGWVEADQGGDVSIRNVIIDGGKIIGGGTQMTTSGALIGSVYHESGNIYTCTVENCHVKNFTIEEKNLSPISRDDIYTGGLIGIVDHHVGSFTMSGCSFEGTIIQNSEASDYVITGGLIGVICYENTDITIENCHSHAVILGNNNTHLGGFVGAIQEEVSNGTVTIENNQFTGAINTTGMPNYLGGFVGDLETSNTLTIQNNLVYMTTALPTAVNSGRIAGRKAGAPKGSITQATLQNNYANITGKAQYNAILDGNDWTGIMGDAPIATWPVPVWTKDLDPASWMPSLTNGPKVPYSGLSVNPPNPPNPPITPTPPTPSIPVVYTVTVSVSEEYASMANCLTLYPTEGKYSVDKDATFTLLVFLNDDCDQSDVQIIANGKTLIAEEKKNELRAIAYTFRIPITEATELKVIGVQRNNTIGTTQPPEGETKVWTSDGHIHVRRAEGRKQEAGGEVRIYTISGQLVVKESMPSHLSPLTFHLPKGIYLLVIGDEVFKVQVE